MSKNAKTTNRRNTERARRVRHAKNPEVQNAEVAEPCFAEVPAPAPEPEVLTPKEKLAEILVRFNAIREELRLTKLAVRDEGREAARAARAARGMNYLEAAFLVLQDFPSGLDSKGLVRRMADRELWKSPCGVTPWSTLYSGIFREIRERGSASRFVRGETKGLFRANPELPAPQAPEAGAAVLA